MGIKIAVVSDLHSTEDCCTVSLRHGKYAVQLLRRILDLLRIRRDIDVLLLCGDLVDSPADMHGLKLLSEVLKSAPCRVVALPGNHDPLPTDFFTVFERFDYLDIRNFRLIFFPDDPEIPGYNAERAAAEITRGHKLCTEFPGQKIFCQHVPLFPPGTPGLHYSYRNAAEIFEQCASDGVTLVISGHQHGGLPPVKYGATTCVGIPALCEEPYSFAVIELSDDGQCAVEILFPLDLESGGKRM